MSTVRVLRQAARNRPVRRVASGYATASMAEWALWVVVLVYVYGAAGTGAAGFAAVALVVPAAVAAPFGGALADGARPARVLTVVYAVSATALTAAAAGAALAVPYPVVVALAAVAITAAAFVRPCLAVVLPAVVTTAEELTAANLLATAGESAAVLLGPLLAATALATGPPSLALATCAVLAAVSAVTMLAVVALDAPATPVVPLADGARPAPPPAPAVRFPAAVRTAARDRSLRALVLVLAGQAVVVGALDLVYVVVAVDDLGLGPGTPGLLAASFGIGAVLGGVGAAGFVGRRRLSPATTAALVAMGAALAVLAARASLPAALALFPLVGLGRTVVDLTSRMLLQRCAAHETVATTFAVVESVSLVASAGGVLGARALIGVAGGRGALAGLAVLAAVLALASATGLHRADERAEVPLVAIRLLRRLPIFAPLPPPALEAVARAARHEAVADGVAIIAEGTPGDTYYVIARGTVTVTMAGRPVRTMHPGEGFGEIALLADVPRTAAVRACGPVELLAVERTAFLAAVLGHDASARTAWAMARRFEPGLPAPAPAPGPAPAPALGVDGPGVAVGPPRDVGAGPGGAR